MRYLKLASVVMAFGLLTLSSPVISQERTAGSSVEVQMTWSTLKSMINSASARTEIVNSRVDQVVACAQKGLLYVPTDIPGANPCVSAAVSSTVLNNITNVQTSIKTMIGCTKNGEVYNGVSCVPIPTTDHRWMSNPIMGAKYSLMYNASVGGTCPKYTQLKDAPAIPKCTTGFAAKCKTKGQVCLVESPGTCTVSTKNEYFVSYTLYNTMTCD